MYRENSIALQGRVDTRKMYQIKEENWSSKSGYIERLQILRFDHSSEYFNEHALPLLCHPDR